jgi:hypothetical protein
VQVRRAAEAAADTGQNRGTGRPAL